MSYCQNNVPSTGKDSTVTINISDIRKINEKLIERKYLIVIDAQKDSIIDDYKQYVIEQENIIKDFQAKIVEQHDLNEKLNKSIKRKKNMNIVLGGVAGTAIITSLALIFSR